jgi:predicted nuclease of predicted toxin-antitoxin system
MKVLLDSCVAPAVLPHLVANGHDVVWCGDWPHDPGDDEILAVAVREQRVLVTIDKDFGDLVFAFGRAHGGIVRLVNLRVSQQALLCAEALRLYQAELLSGAIVTVESFRTRVRPPL